MEWLLAISRARKIYNACIARSFQKPPRTPQETKIASSGRRAVMHRCCQALSTFLGSLFVVARADESLKSIPGSCQIDPRRFQNQHSEAPNSSQGRLVASRSAPRAPKSIPRASQERPRTSQERPRASQERHKSAPRAPKSAPRAPKSTPRVTQELPR